MWFERNVMYSVCIYDLSVLAVSRMGFQKKKLDKGVGRALSKQIWIFGIFLTLQSPLVVTTKLGVSNSPSFSLIGHLFKIPLSEL